MVCIHSMITNGLWQSNECNVHGDCRRTPFVLLRPGREVHRGAEGGLQREAGVRGLQLRRVAEVREGDCAWQGLQMVWNGVSVWLYPLDVQHGLGASFTAKTCHGKGQDLSRTCQRRGRKRTERRGRRTRSRATATNARQSMEPTPSVNVVRSKKTSLKSDTRPQTGSVDSGSSVVHALFPGLPSPTRASGTTGRMARCT